MGRCSTSAAAFKVKIKYMTVHTFGDSHAYCGWSEVTTNHLGAYLCYSFGRDNYICDIRNNPSIKDGDTLIFCFGEIDCRCHIRKHVSLLVKYQLIIDNIVNNYIKTIKLNISTSQLKLRNVCIYNVVPPVQKHTIDESAEYPHLGTDEERKQYVLYFNKKLKEKCAENGYIFFDVYDKYVDENGFLRKDLSDGNVHIGDGTHITNFMLTHNIR